MAMMGTHRHTIVSSPTVMFLTLFFAFANCFTCIHAGSFPQSGNYHPRSLPLHVSTTFLTRSSKGSSYSAAAAMVHSTVRGGSIFVEQEHVSNNTSIVHDTTLVPPPSNETTAFRYSAQDVVDDHVDVADPATDPVPSKKGLKILFLSADTGGGHRASAESLAKQFLKQYPGSEYELVDVWTPTMVYPYYTLVPSYKYLSAHPQRWKALYYISNTRWYEKITNVHSTITCYNKIKQQLQQYDPDVVVSVHPTMNYLPEKIMREISQERNKYVPFFTVVTDFGSGHCTWFQGTVDKMYVASERIKTLARRRGAKVKEEHLVMMGLPIRDEFARLAERMEGRTTEGGKVFRKEVKVALGLEVEKKVVLVMGGGEGVGSLEVITEQLYWKLREEGVDATICVVCGRNEKTRMALETKDWDASYAKVQQLQERRKNRRRFRLSKMIGRKLKRIHDKGYSRDNTRMSSNAIASSRSGRHGKVNVIGLGFMSNIADYMVASDVLVSKAGPGTIAEAASVGLPVMITSFLPGQEAGNVQIVLDGGFGAFERNPKKIAEKVSYWLQNEAVLDEMSLRSEAAGNPHAASEIVRDIGRITMDILEHNQKRNR